MRAILIFLFCFSGIVWGSGLRVVQVIPFGTSSVRITFDRDVSNLSLKEHKLKDFRSFLDIEAVLATSRKDYVFSNHAQVSVAQNNPKILRIVIKTNKDTTYKTKIVQKYLYVSVIDKLPDAKDEKTPASAKTKTKEKQEAKTASSSKKSHAEKTVSKNASKTKSSVPKTPDQKLRELKKKFKIVIDPGHGGKDCGAMGITKVCEKVIVLSVGKFLEQELKKRGYVTYMTRDKDVYVNLKERTDFANAKNADLFVSIHANSVPKTSSDSPHGVETYFLSTARSERARKVAELENKDDVDVMNYFSRFSFLNSLNSHRLIASNKLAIDVQFGILRELRKHYQGVSDGGVREGPFWVLAGALMPSILIEIGYNSNPIEARRIDDKRYQRFLSKGIADGIDGYFVKNHP